MPIVSGGGGTFNGGTITTPLVIDDSAGGSLVPLDVLGGGNWEIDAQRVDLGGGTVDAVLDLQAGGSGRAFMRLRNGTGSSDVHVGSDTITFDSGSNTATDTMLEVSSAFWGQLLVIFADHIQASSFLKCSFPVVLQNHAAPADGTLSAGDCALWFDQTNGAAKLMVKAKSANGTVVTGSVTLA